MNHKSLFFSRARLVFSLLGLLLSALAFSSWALAQNYQFTLDFEDGTLRGWKATGNAFNFQPTRGDNPTARKRGQPSNHQGYYWIGTYEKYQGHKDQRPGDIQGDTPQGILTSVSFTIPKGRLTFLVGGGSSSQTRVELLAGLSSDIEFMEKVHTASGKNSETMGRVSWDLSVFAGKIGKIRIVDASSGPWGHINVDDFHFISAELPQIKKLTPMVPNVVEQSVAVPKPVFVPNVIGKTVETARAILEKAGLKPGGELKLPSDRPEGIVLEQKPTRGAQVAAGTVVDLVVAVPKPVSLPNEIEKKVEVPPIEGHGIEEAKDILENVTLQVGEIEERPSDATPGTVIGQSPGPGEWVGIGSRIDLAVAIKALTEMIEVPNVIGLPLVDARQVLEERGLALGVVGERTSNLEAGRILEQSPGGGNQSHPGDAVSLVIAAKGPTVILGKVAAVLVAGGSAGMLLLRLMRRRRGTGDFDVELKVISQIDEGFQNVHFSREKEIPILEIVLRPVPDSGKQMLVVKGPLIAEKEDGND